MVLRYGWLKGIELDIYSTFGRTLKDYLIMYVAGTGLIVLAIAIVEI